MPEGNNFNTFPFDEKSGVLQKISRKNQWIILISVLILFAFGGYFFFKRAMNIKTPEESILNNQPISRKSQTENPVMPSSNQVEATPPLGGVNYQSENFRAGDIAIGGEVEFLLAESTPEPLQISGVNGESFMEKNKQEVKLALFWKTNKLAKSQVAYSKGVGQTQKTASEEDYALNHSLIISGLDQASTYVYTISSQDRFGNMAKSDQYAVYTGAENISLFDLISNAVSDVFGWAISSR